jgi:hypothetical protein
MHLLGSYLDMKASSQQRINDTGYLKCVWVKLPIARQMPEVIKNGNIALKDAAGTERMRWFPSRLESKRHRYQFRVIAKGSGND